jgi:hypothetical protein
MQKIRDHWASSTFVWFTVAFFILASRFFLLWSVFVSLTV